jgi:hypothetical protein
MFISVKYMYSKNYMPYNICNIHFSVDLTLMFFLQISGTNTV